MQRRRVFIIHELHPTTLSRILSGVVEYAGPRDHWEIVRHRETEMQTPAFYSAHADGILLRSTDPRRFKLAHAGVPTVALLEERALPEWGIINLDDRAIGMVAGKHLVGMGLKRLGYWGPEETWSLRRLEGFTDAARRRGARCITLHDLLGQQQRIDWRHLEDGVSLPRWLRLLRPPAGVLAYNDRAAADVIRFAREANLRVPEDLAVIGVDNELINCEPTPIPITAVDTNLVRMGFESAQWLDRMMDGLAFPAAPVLVPPREVVKRRSTDMLAVEDPDVRNALAYIRSHGCEGITINDVLAQVPICRRALERRFISAIGRTPGQELRIIKLERAATLLRDTTFKLGAIAAQCGFASSTHLSAAFQKHFGVTTSAYREQ